jgi:hypothetical protein
VIESGVDDVCISVNPSLSKAINCNATFNNELPLVSSSVTINIHFKTITIVSSIRFASPYAWLTLLLIMKFFFNVFLCSSLLTGESIGSH